MKLYLALCAVTSLFHVYQYEYDIHGKKELTDGICTAVFVAPDKLLTAGHCVSDATGQMWIRDLENSYQVKIIGTDYKEDLALLRTIKPLKHKYVTLGEPAFPTLPVYSVNFEHDIPMAYGEGKVVGWIMLDDDSPNPLLVVSFPIAGGASGGGLFNAKHELVGLLVRSGPVGADAVDQPVIKQFLKSHGIE